jgi:hypothetical protein
MTDQFRDMCAELLADYDNCHYRSELSDRAHALLAQPVAEGPTDEEIYKMALEGDFLVDVGDGFSCMVQDEVEFARAVLARWGRPAIQPVPVSERLPGPEDCDVEGRCWWLDRPSKNGPAAWILRRPDDGLLIPFLAWLPHGALPVPTPANNAKGED